MIEIDWPKFDPEDSRWGKSFFDSSFVLVEDGSDKDLKTIWGIDLSKLPNQRSRREIVKNKGLHRNVEELSYPEGVVVPPISTLLRCHLLHSSNGNREELSLNSTGRVWRELSRNQDSFFNSLETKYSPDGVILESKISTSDPESNRFYDTNFDFSNLDDGWINYSLTYAEVRLRVDELLKKLKQEGQVTVSGGSFAEETLLKGRFRLGEEVRIFGGMNILVDQDLRSEELKLTITRRLDQTTQSKEILMADRVQPSLTLFKEACTKGFENWEKMIKSVKLSSNS